MLVWLASYPCSGAALLSRALKTCFDLDSYERSDLAPARSCEPGGTWHEHCGASNADPGWEAFCEQARVRPELALVTTHRLPPDDSNAIYVVRDGRLALRSFALFRDSHHPGTSTVESLVLGEYPFGDWTGHYRAWCEGRRGELLLLRFEELTNPNVALLAKIGAYLGVDGPVRPDACNLEGPRAQRPTSVGAEELVWARDAFWTDARLRQFYTLHGPLLARLGYASATEVEAGAYPPQSNEGQWLRHVYGFASRLLNLERVRDTCAVELRRLLRECQNRCT